MFHSIRRRLVVEYKESRLSDDQRKRAHVLREIVSTEETYVGVLRICIDVCIIQLSAFFAYLFQKQKYLAPLREDLRKPKHVVNDQDLPALFSTIELIHQVNTDMLNDLQDRLKQWPTVNSFGPVFISMVCRIFLGSSLIYKISYFFLRI